MSVEIERKFLLAEGTGSSWKKFAKAVLRCRQGYIFADAACAVRVRICGGKAFLAVKSALAGISRQEFEYPIPLEDAEDMLRRLAKKPLVEKDRHLVDHAGLTWEVDEFLEENQGLVIAEVELEREEQPLEKPDWAGREVTGDARYYNSNLADMPYSRWKEK